MAAIPNRFGHNNEKNPEGMVEDVHDPQAGLASWCMAKVKHGRDVRREKFDERWREYTRLWRGFWSAKDQNTDSERSKIITPALQQSIEMTVSEMEEAVFNRTAWFDIEDDLGDEQKDDALTIRDNLLEDFEIDNVQDAISKCFLLGAIYGTGIAKINVMEKNEAVIIDRKVENVKRVAVTVEAIRPDEFVIDPSALTVDEALYVAHQVIRPLHLIRKRIAEGGYRKTQISPYLGEKQDTYGTRRWDNAEVRDESVLITEYCGKVPGRYFGKKGMVEAIVTIGNHGILLKAVENPYLMQDRPYVAYQHDTVPGEFWGRGVSEKGYNPQKALDAEVRARIDALALTTAPMMGADITKLPRNADMRVRPGKTIFTRGRPSETFEPVNFAAPQVLAHTFQQTGDLERMVQVGTGAMDSATPVGVNRRNETAGGMSMMNAAFIKRSKRTMKNLERQFLDPLIKKASWRYQQFNPKRYPEDTTFIVNATMGIMAKEVENQQLTQMMGYVPPESPAHAILLKAIFDNTASANKKELSDAIAAMQQPPSPEEQQQQAQMQALQMEALQLQIQEQQLNNKKLQAQIEQIMAETIHTHVKADLEDDKVDIQAANTAIGAKKAAITDRQTDVAAERNQIDLLKVRKGQSS